MDSIGVKVHSEVAKVLCRLMFRLIRLVSTLLKVLSASSLATTSPKSSL
jgi:hypothetical protein